GRSGASDLVVRRARGAAEIRSRRRRPVLDSAAREQDCRRKACSLSPSPARCTSEGGNAMTTTQIEIPKSKGGLPMHEQKHIVETVKTGIIESIRGTGEVVDAAIDTVSGTLVNTLKSTGAVGAALTGTVSDVLRGAILGTAHVGADIRGAAKGGVIGVIRSTRERKHAAGSRRMGGPDASALRRQACRPAALTRISGRLLGPHSTGPSAGRAAAPAWGGGSWRRPARRTVSRHVRGPCREPRRRHRRRPPPVDAQAGFWCVGPPAS